MCPVGSFCSGGGALNISCYPAMACAVAGLSAQPPCFWNVSTIAGTGVAGFAEGDVSTAPMFNNPLMITMSSDNMMVIIADSQNNRIRGLWLSNSTTINVAGSGILGFANGAARTATFNCPYGVAVANGSVYIGDYRNHQIRKVSGGIVFTVAGGGGGAAFGATNGVGTNARFREPLGLSLDPLGNIYVADFGNNLIRQIRSDGQTFTIGTSSTYLNPYHTLFHLGLLYITDENNHVIKVLNVSSGVVSVLAGAGVAGAMNGFGSNARFNQPMSITVARGIAAVTDWSNHRIRFIETSSGYTTSIAGGGTAGFSNGFGSLFNYPTGIVFTNDGNLIVADQANHRIRQLTCVPCPASFYCFSGAPVLCPAGSYCPLSSMNATACPAGTYSPDAGASRLSDCAACSAGFYCPGDGSRAACPSGSFCQASSARPSSCPPGSYSNASGASNCMLCPAGTYNWISGAVACDSCPEGHFCPMGTSMRVAPNCGFGNYCPEGSPAPIPCPITIPPGGGSWADHDAEYQGPAFFVDTSACYNLCFWVENGDGTRFSGCED